MFRILRNIALLLPLFLFTACDQKGNHGSSGPDKSETPATTPDTANAVRGFKRAFVSFGGAALLGGWGPALSPASQLS
ncbi:MAG: hypothetical protein GX846_02805 [Deltaproteobacteria bacterium]|nr:hypothetical protein [Deltaproteobacteria bacterium]